MSPGATPAAVRSICETPHVPSGDPMSDPLKAGCPASGLPLPSARVARFAGPLKVYAAAGIGAKSPPLTL